jgi:hypothetical protein
MKQINIFELQSSVNRKKEMRVKVFSKILGKCHCKIKEAAKNELYLCHYNVPEYVVGLPIYNISDCIEYVVGQLEENGFVVEHVYSKYIIISWFPSNKLENNEHSDKNTLLLNYIPYKNTKGKFVLNVD